MGNRANRKKAQEYLSAWGFKGRLWTGKMSWAQKNDIAATVITTFRFRPGDMVNDCDAFNHRIIALSGREGGLHAMDTSDKNAIEALRCHHTLGVSIALWSIPQYLFEDGRLSCGCPAGCETALTRKEIEEYFLSITDEYIAEQKRLGWWNEASQKKVDAVRAGHHICDEQGICLPEFR